MAWPNYQSYGTIALLISHSWWYIDTHDSTWSVGVSSVSVVLVWRETRLRDSTRQGPSICAGRHGVVVLRADQVWCCSCPAVWLWCIYVPSCRGNSVWVSASGTATRAGHIHTRCTDTRDRDQNLIGPIFGPWSLDRGVKRALTLDRQPGMGGVWAESEVKPLLTLIE